MHVVAYDAFDTVESINLTEYSGCAYLAIDIVHLRRKKWKELSPKHYKLLNLRVIIDSIGIQKRDMNHFFH